MKKFLFHFAAVAVVATTLLTTSCTKDEGNIYRLKIHQYTSADKTSLGDGGVTLWSDGDEVYVNGTTTVQISGNVSDYETSIDERLPIDGRLYCFYAGNATMAGFDASTKTFTYTMPSSVNYDGTKLNAPMVGANDGNDVDFENICTMLKLEFPVGITSTGNRTAQIVITSVNSALSGEFTATYGANGWTVIGPEITDANNTIIIGIARNTTVYEVYVPLPAGNHKLTISGQYFTKSMNEPQDLLESYIYPITCAHAFSVGDQQKVYFAQGNLIRTDPTTFSFASSQSFTSQYQRSSFETGNNFTHDMFFPHDANHIPSVPESFNINNKNDWRVLSTEEWVYLLNRNDRAKRSLAKVGVGDNYIEGMIILPDVFPTTDELNYTWTTETTTTGTGTSTKYTTLTIDRTDWEKMEARGAVFLPVTGYVSYAANTNNRTLSKNYHDGNYGTSTSGKNLRFYKATNNTNHFINWNNVSGNTLASAYRLVRNAN